jgi:hypothetical protein
MEDYLYNLAEAVRTLAPESHDSHLYALEVRTFVGFTYNTNNERICTRQDFEGLTRAMIMRNEAQLTMVETKTNRINKDPRTSKKISFYHSTGDNNVNAYNARSLITDPYWLPFGSTPFFIFGLAKRGVVDSNGVRSPDTCDPLRSRSTILVKIAK